MSIKQLQETIIEKGAEMDSAKEEAFAHFTSNKSPNEETRLRAKMYAFRFKIQQQLLSLLMGQQNRTQWRPRSSTFPIGRSPG